VGEVAERRYKAWGETRYTWGTTPTTYRYTGQRQEEGLGLYHMGARWYDPALSRWLSADTLVPEAGEPQSFNRYSYVLGNPLRYIDPTGHKSREQWEQEFRDAHGGQDPTDQDWWDYQFSLQIAGWSAGNWVTTCALRALLYIAGVTIKSGDAQWTLEEIATVGQVVSNIAQAFGAPVSRIIGGVTLKRMHKSLWPLGFGWKPGGAWEALGTVRVNDSAFAVPGNAEHALTHELGHYFQESQGLIDDFRKATGGSQFNLFGMASLNLTPYKWGGTPPNEWVKKNGLYEDFAASFEIFVYQQIGDPCPGAVMDTSRFRFFHQFVQIPWVWGPR